MKPQNFLGFYKKNHYDLAGFCVGAVERDRLLPLPVKEGDVIVGLPSSGIHSNGYSLVHKIISNNNIDLKKESLGDNKLIKLLLEPTRIYTKEVQTITKRTNTLKAVAHITGGGLTENLPRVISESFHLRFYCPITQLPLSIHGLSIIASLRMRSL